MKIWIQGVDYSASLDAKSSLTIERKLNEPTSCLLWLSISAGTSLATPVRNQSLAILGDDGTKYFTGYIASSPLPEFAGMASDGPRYRIAIRALSDELLLDQLPVITIKVAAGMTAGQLLTSLVMHTRSTALATQDLSLAIPISTFVTAPGASWSQRAGQLASQARASYRALDGNLNLSSIPAVVHPLSEGDGTLSLASLALTANVSRMLANDVTVCGEHEPVAYVTEYFQGDGATAQFTLGATPFFPPAAKAKIIAELFNESALDQGTWSSTGGSGYLAVGAAGLILKGGNGIDGQTALSWNDSIELGGTLLLEAKGVSLAQGSAGILAGLFIGVGTLPGCIAGFEVQCAGGNGAVTLQPVVQGAANGSTYTVNPANQYALRIRIHCPECERTLSTYRSFGDQGAIAFGGQSNEAPAQLLFEIQEFVNGVAGMPVVLFDGTISGLSENGTVVAASLLNMTGTMRAFSLTQLGSGWVTSTPAGGNQYTRRFGTANDAGECYLERTGTLLFSTGYAPKAGERVSVSYRTTGRAVGRAVNAASQQELASAGLPPVQQWTGSVTNPIARSSADCRNAALTIAETAASVSALWSGKYTTSSSSVTSDVWPGDALLLNAPSMNMNSQMVVRTVRLTYASSYPDLVRYDISFANDWADDLAIKTSGSVPADAWLLVPVCPVVLPNLSNLQITAMSGTTVTINTGTSPSPGGGFEIRRRDFTFMPGNDPDLVMRGSQQTMTFSRETANDRFYIRMFDSASPPNYSEFSTAVFINLPLGS